MAKPCQNITTLVIIVGYLILLTVIWTWRRKEPEELGYSWLDEYEDARSLCSLVNDDCPRLFTPTWSDGYTTASKYGIATCCIPKSMSALMNGLMCYLHDSEAFMAANMSITRQVWGNERFCYTKNEHSRAILAEQFPNFTKFIIVRDPIARFVSGFVDKCINEACTCHGCSRNLSCFVDAQYESLMAWSRGSVVHMDPYSDHHFSPQNWRCDIEKDIYNLTIFKHGGVGNEKEKMVQQIDQFLIKHGVPDHERITVVEAMKGGKTGHATRGSTDADNVKKELFANPEVLKKVVKMYYYDYILFGFEFPKIPTVRSNS